MPFFYIYSYFRGRMNERGSSIAWLKIKRGKQEGRFRDNVNKMVVVFFSLVGKEEYKVMWLGFTEYV